MSKSHKPAQRSVALVIGGMSTVMAMPVVANEAAGLEEIVVTARKREENLQDVSMSITAITSGEIEKMGISDVEDSARLDAPLIYDN